MPDDVNEETQETYDLVDQEFLDEVFVDENTVVIEEVLDETLPVTVIEDDITYIIRLTEISNLYSLSLGKVEGNDYLTSSVFEDAKKFANAGYNTKIFVFHSETEANNYYHQLSMFVSSFKKQKMAMEMQMFQMNEDFKNQLNGAFPQYEIISKG